MYIFAKKENCAVPSIFKDYDHKRYCDEYLVYYDTHKLLDQLSALRVTVNSNVISDTKDGYIVLSISFRDKTVQYRAFPSEEEEKATYLFSQIEQNIESDEAALLVSIAKMQESNEKKLEEIQKTVDEKLTKTLNDRFNESFKVLTEELTKVSQTIGEMQKISSDVGNLSKMLSNVKTSVPTVTSAAGSAADAQTVKTVSIIQTVSRHTRIFFIR